MFSKDAFKKFAEDNLVLMEVDFPREKEQPDEVKAQNEKLDKAFGIKGYPTVYLVNEKGEKISPDIGYREGGADAYVKHLKELIAEAGNQSA